MDAVVQRFNFEIFEAAFPQFIQLAGNFHFLFNGFDICLVVADKLLAGFTFEFDRFIEQFIRL